MAPSPEADERDTVAGWLAEHFDTGVQPHEVGVFVRSDAEIARARAAVESARVPYVLLDERVAATSGKVAISTMHLAKGLEFRTVVVMACDDDVVPSQRRSGT